MADEKELISDSTDANNGPLARLIADPALEPALAHKRDTRPDDPPTG